MQRGCLRPLFLSLGVIGLFTVGLLMWYADTTRLMWNNARALSEGSEWAERLRSPEDVLAYLAAHADDVSLVCFDLDDPRNGVYHHPDTLRPTVGLDEWRILTAYARQAVRDTSFSHQTVTTGTLDRYVLPGSARAIRTRDAVTPADTLLSLEEVARKAWVDRDRSALDLLLMRLHDTDRQDVFFFPSMASADSPLPHAGMFLSWGNHTASFQPAARLEEFVRMDRRSLGDTVYAWQLRYLEEDAFRAREYEQRLQSGTELSLMDQRALAGSSFPRSSARDWARLLEQVWTDSIDPSGTGARVRAMVEQPGDPETPFELVVARSSGFPGLYSVAGYGLVRGRSQPRLLILVIENLPLAVFYHLSRTGLAAGLAAQFLADDQTLEQAKAGFSEKKNGG